MVDPQNGNVPGKGNSRMEATFPAVEQAEMDERYREDEEGCLRAQIS